MDTLQNNRETKIQWEQTEKQAEAWEYLQDKTTVELLFGGGAGGGKTALLCRWEVFMCLSYLDVRGFLGRESLEDFKKSTLLELFDVFKQWGLKDERDYIHHQQDKYFHFFQTKSRIYYNELGFYPTDPDFNYLGSTQFTFAGIDEANQVHKKAKNVLRSRIRYHLAENGLTPKLALSCNPDKGYLYSDFYKPWKNGTLAPDKRFVQALAVDNWFNDPSYVKNLEGIDDLSTKERLLFGNWEYDADPSKLIEFDAINDLFTNIIAQTEPKKYITVDVARQGQDKTVLVYWEGWAVREIRFYEKIPLLSPVDDPTAFSTEKAIQDMRAQYGVPMSKVLVDEDGMGGGVVDRLHCKGFLNGSSALKKENYANLKTQCYYKYSKKVALHETSIHVTDARVRDWIIQELEQVRTKNADKDGKLQILSKAEVKLRIGRSPDFSDSLAMRAFFDLVPTPSIVWI